MRPWLALAGLNGAIGVIAGAFAAHALKGHLSADMAAAFETGARYQLIHAVALGLAGYAVAREPASRATAAAWLFLVGIVLFSGSLYTLALTGLRAAGFVTPLGGLSLIGGWLALAWAGLERRA